MFSLRNGSPNDLTLRKEKKREKKKTKKDEEEEEEKVHCNGPNTYIELSKFLRKQQSKKSDTPVRAQWYRNLTLYYYFIDSQFSNSKMSVTREMFTPLFLFSAISSRINPFRLDL